jgi:hypothetical protein
MLVTIVIVSPNAMTTELIVIASSTYHRTGYGND